MSQWSKSSSIGAGCLAGTSSDLRGVRMMVDASEGGCDARGGRSNGFMIGVIWRIRGNGERKVEKRS